MVLSSVKPKRGSTARSAPLSRFEIDDLVALAQGGDSAAFAELVQATYKDTYTLAFRLTSDPEDARDVAQDAYIRAFKGLDKFRGDSHFSTWLYRITANCASSHLGRRSRQRHEPLSDSIDLADVSGDYSPELRADASDLRSSVGDALDTLAPILRAVVVLRDVYEISHEEIAEELGISVTAAKVRLHRARRKLRAQVYPELDEVEFRAL